MPSYVITSPEGKKFKVSGNGTKEDALAYFQSTYSPSAPVEQKPLSEQRYQAEEDAQKKANEEANIFQQFGRGVKAQAGRFALGTAELANNLTGDRLIDPEVLATAQRGADVIDRGTGAAGFIGNIAGDPLTWLPMGKVAKGIKAAKTVPQIAKATAKAGAIAGGLSGLIQSTGDEKSNIGTNLKNAAIGGGVGFGLGGTTPYVGAGVKKGTNMAGGFIDRVAAGFGSNKAANNVAYKNIAEVLTNQGYAPSEVASIIDDFKANGIKGGTLGQMLESSDLLSREKNLLQGGGVAGRVMSKNLKAQPDLVANSINEKLGGIYQPETTSYLYKQAAEGAVTPIYGQKMGTVRARDTNAANVYLKPAVDSIEKELKLSARELPKTVNNSISRIIKDMREGAIGVDKGKQMLDDLYVDAASTAEQKTVNRVVLGMRKKLNSALEEAGGEPYAAAKIAAESDRVIREALEAFDTTNVGSLKTALNKFYGTPEKQREFLDKLPNEAVRNEFKDYLAKLQKISGNFGGSDTASNQATQKAMNAASGFGIEGDITPRGLLSKLAEPISKNVRKAQAEATFNPNVDTLTEFMRGKPYKAGMITKAIPQISTTIPRATSEDERNSNKPNIVYPQSPIQEPAMQPEAAAKPDLLQRIAQVESGGNPNAKNPNSSASGLYQFTNGTWAEMVSKYGKKTGITEKDKNNPEAQQIMASLLIEENAEKLQQALGRDATDGELYMAHFLGANGAKKLINAMGTGKNAAMLFPEAARANRTIFFTNGKPRTVEQIYQLLTKKMSA